MNAPSGVLLPGFHRGLCRLMAIIIQIKSFFAGKIMCSKAKMVSVYVGVDKYTPAQESTFNLITLLANGSDASKQRQWKPWGTL